MRFDLLRRLWRWLFRVYVGFVLPFRRFAFGVGFGLPGWRWFRSSLMACPQLVFILVLHVSPRFCSCTVVSFYLFLIPTPRVGDPGENLGNSRRKLAVFTKRSAYTSLGKWSYGRLVILEESKSTPLVIRACQILFSEECWLLF